MASNPFLPSLLIIALLSVSTFSLFKCSSAAGEMAVYWGTSNEEGSIYDACSTKLYDIINMGFVTNFGDGRTPKLEMKHCNPSVGGCTYLGAEIERCRSLIPNFKVLISIGGPKGNYSLSSVGDTVSLVTYLWDNFLSGESSSRPFGNAVLDGVDVYYGPNPTKLSQLYVTILASILKLNNSVHGERKLYFSIAPPCEQISSYINDATETESLIDYVWPRFYKNSACVFDASNADKIVELFRAWSSDRKRKLLMGLSASPDHKGFIPANQLKADVLPKIKKDPNYGGVMLWNRHYDAISHYGQQIRADVIASETVLSFKGID